MLLQAPTFFKLAETKPGTVLVERGVLKKEDVSERFGNRQFYFHDKGDGKLKCLSGGSLAYLIDLHGINDHMELKIVYAGTETVENGKFAGKEAHQFEVELLNEGELDAAKIKEVQDNMEEKSETTEATSLDSLE